MKRVMVMSNYCLLQYKCNSSVACVGPSVTTSSTDFSLQNLVV
jgi:hypothetical protein